MNEPSPQSLSEWSSRAETLALMLENCKVDQLAVIALKMKISELLSSPF